MNQDKQITLVAGLLLVLFLAWIFADISTYAVGAAAGTTVVMFVLYNLVQKNQLPSLSSLQEQNPQGNLENTVGIEGLKRILNKWAEQNYGEQNHIQISWDFTDYDMVPLRDWNETLAAVTGAFGQSDTEIQVFVETTTPKVVGHKKIRTKHQFKRPFKYSDYFQEYKRKTRTGSDIDLNPSRQPRGYGYRFGGMPPRPAPQNPDSNTGSDEEE